MEYHSTLKMKGILHYETAQKDLEVIMVSETSHLQKGKCSPAWFLESKSGVVIVSGWGWERSITNQMGMMFQSSKMNKF